MDVPDGFFFRLEIKKYLPKCRFPPEPPKALLLPNIGPLILLFLQLEEKIFKLFLKFFFFCDFFQKPVFMEDNIYLIFL